MRENRAGFKARELVLAGHLLPKAPMLRAAEIKRRGQGATERTRAPFSSKRPPAPPTPVFSFSSSTSLPLLVCLPGERYETRWNSTDEKRAPCVRR